MRDPVRAPIAAALQKAMREKAAVCIRTLALAADEAHRQIPIDERDRHLHCCQHRAGRCSSHQHCGNTWHCFSILFLVPSTVSGKSQCPHMAHAGGWRCTISKLGAMNNTDLFYCSSVSFPRFPRYFDLEQDSLGIAVSLVVCELVHQSFMFGIARRRADQFVRWTRE